MSEFVRENPAKAEMTEVLCCCDPNNLVGVVPTQAGLDAGLQLRDLEEGGQAFDSNDNPAAVRDIPGFVPPENIVARKTTGTKTWKKTWKKIDSAAA